MNDIDVGAFTVKGTERVAAKIRAVRNRAEHPTASYWNKVGSFLRGTFREQFRTQGMYLGTPWKPLSRPYAAWKARSGYSGRPMLVQTGELRDSYILKRDAYQVVNGNTGEFGSGNRLAIFHQAGTTRNGRPAIPARKVVVASSPIVKKGLHDVTVRYIAGKDTTYSSGDDS